MKPQGSLRCFMVFQAAFFFLVLHQVSVESRLLSIPKPDPNNAVATARWLVSQNSWGVLKYTLCLSPIYVSTFLISFLLYFDCLILFDTVFDVD